jgi:hypothetical protein
MGSVTTATIIGEDAEPPPLESADEQHRERDDHEHEPRPEVRLQQDQRERKSGVARYTEHVSRFLDLAVVSGDDRREHHDEDELRRLGWLEQRYRADLQP